MAKKQAPKRVRKPNFPFIFWDGLRDKAQAAADEDFGGNLTQYVNTLVNADTKARAKAKK